MSTFISGTPVWSDAQEIAKLRQQLTDSQKQVARARDWFSEQLKEPLDADDLASLRAEYEALADTADLDGLILCSAVPVVTSPAAT